ncbi:MAG: STAS-like domain-containing protein [Myxococcota bacterium]
MRTGDVAALTGVSRQAAHKQLRAMVAAGRLVVEGKARAARYRLASAVDDSQPALLAPGSLPLADNPPVDDSPQASRVRLEVASAGAEFRLSARILLCDVTAAELVVDFAGVEDVADEFLDELLVRYAEAHPQVRLEIVNAAATIRAAVARVCSSAPEPRIALAG